MVIVNENSEDIDFNCDAGLVGISITLDVMPRASRIAAKGAQLVKEIFAENSFQIGSILTNKFTAN